MDRFIHTPEGVRDIYSSECKKKQYLQQKVQEVFSSYGYDNIETPMFEYFDVFGKEVGTTPSRELYKFFDREGNTLALRPDFTPSIARAVSMHYTAEQMPIRLCYKGNVFVNRASYRGRPNEATQMGVEFLNDDSAAADAEIIAMVIQVMQKAGLKEFQVSIGQVAYFQALVQEAHLDPGAVAKLRYLISSKNHFGAEEFVEKLHLRKDLQMAFGQLPLLFGNVQILEKAKELTKNQTALAAVKRLETIYRILQTYGLEQYVVFDFGLLSKLNYYTGIIFQAYTYGSGEAIVTGGRYDQLLAHFNKKAPAIGFAIVMDQLINALDTQKLSSFTNHTKTMILYADFLEEQAIRMAAAHRAEGIEIACVRFERDRVLEDYKAYGRRADFGGIVYLQSETEAFAINIWTEEVQVIDAKQYLAK